MTNEKEPKHTISKHEGPDHASPYPVSRLAPPIQLVDLAREIEKADRMIATRISAKLRVISDQIKQLQDQAREVLENAKLDQNLHRVACSFKRIPGKIYYLYAKENDNRYFSMLSPDDWHGSPPDVFIGSYRLEADMSWTPAEKIEGEDGFNDRLSDFVNSRNM